MPSRRNSGPADYDLVVIGGGSAGFAAAIKAAEQDARVALVEAETIGGTCVNVGCVPSKTLIRAAELRHRAAHHAFAGVRTHAEAPDYGAVIQQKDELVAALRQAKYLDVLGAYPQVELIRGRARFAGRNEVAVDGRVLLAGRTVIATGARPWAPPIPGLADAGYWTSTEAMDAPEPPESLIVVGASAVGLELGQFFARMGTRVTFLEAMPRIVPAEDAEVGVALQGYLEDEGIAVHTGVTVRRVRRDGPYRVEAELGGAVREFAAERLLVATGRRPNTAGLDLGPAGVATDEKGYVRVNDFLQTTNPDVFAAGDAAIPAMFVYVAAYSGGLAAENALNGLRRRFDLSGLPRVTFTDPQLASVGVTEDEARQTGRAIKTATLPLEYVPRALANRDTRGLIKLVADASSGEILGVHILAPEAGEVIQEGVIAVKYGLTVEDLVTTFHPYLTMVEGLKLAATAFDKDVSKLSCCVA